MVVDPVQEPAEALGPFRSSTCFIVGLIVRYIDCA
jgi:hypothetical protein